MPGTGVELSNASASEEKNLRQSGEATGAESGAVTLKKGETQRWPIDATARRPDLAALVQAAKGLDTDVIWSLVERLEQHQTLARAVKRSMGALLE